MDKIILVGGGTGGHCIPMASLYKKFSKLNIKCFIITDKRGSVFFKDLNPKDVIILKVPTKLITRFEQLINFPIIYIQILMILINTKSTHILGFGGYITLPILLCAKTINRKISIHEANAVMGKANRILSKYVVNIFTTFNETKKLNIKFIQKIHNVGMPLREEFKDCSNKKNKEYVISIIGGSQGSSSLSKEVVLAMIKFKEKIDCELLVYHQCRVEDVTAIKDKYNEFKISSEVSNYFIDMPQKMFDSNIIISRAGSSTINEIIYTNKPSILIPFPFAIDDHQFYNASFLEKNLCASIIKDSDLSSDLILNDLLGFYQNSDKINFISQKLKSLNHKNTANKILNFIQKQNVN